MPLCELGREAAIAWLRSVVKVAIPQRRGSELPINAKRRGAVNGYPAICLSLIFMELRLSGPAAWSVRQRTLDVTMSGAGGRSAMYAGIHMKAMAIY